MKESKFPVHLDTPEDRAGWHVKVDKSRLLQGELGLFAWDPRKKGRVFKKGDQIAPYLGEHLSTAERKRRYGNKWGPYIYFKPFGHPSIDAQYYRSAAAYANDGAWIIDGDSIRPRRPTKDNCILYKGWLVASRNIKHNDEILLDYSYNYWKNRYLDEMPKSSIKQTGGSLTGSLQELEDSLDILTPIEKHHGVWFKRDDLYQIAGAIGGKARSCVAIIVSNPGLKGLITAGSRMSPQVEIVGKLSQYLGLPFRCHLPKGQLPDNIQSAISQGKVKQHFPGYNHILNYHAHQDALRTGYLEIPFGMQHEMAVQQTREQCENLPKDIKRIILAVGSGMTLAGILWGLRDSGRCQTRVIGIIVGADPTKTLDRFAPKDWRKQTRLIKSTVDYHQTGEHQNIGDIPLDPIYESKVVPYLKKGDLFWIIGHRGGK